MLFFLIWRREYEENIILFINVHLLFITNINWGIRLFIYSIMDVSISSSSRHSAAYEFLIGCNCI